MKKNILLLLLAGLFLAGCASESVYTPKNGGKYVPFEEEEDEEEAEDDTVTCTYQFFFSYSHTTMYDEVYKKDVSCPILVLREKEMFKPLGSVPEEVNTKEKVIALAKAKGYPEASLDTETFSKFLGFSYNTVCLDESGLWDFASDTKQQAIISLYGIWVSE